MKNINFAFITGTELPQWQLITAEGEYTLSYNSGSLWATLTSAPTVGQIICRPLTDAELGEYRRIRRAQRTTIEANKVSKEKAEKKAAEKKAAQEAAKVEKEARRAEEAKRCELRRLRDELKKLEAADKAAEEAAKKAEEEAAEKSSSEREAAVAVIIDRIANLSSLADAIGDKVHDLWTELRSLGGEAKAWDNLSHTLIQDNLDTLTEDDLNGIALELLERAENVRNRQMDLPYEIAELKAKKYEAIAERKALKTVLKSMASNAIDAPFVIALAEKLRVRKPKDPDKEIREAARIPQKAKVENYACRTFKAKVLYASLTKERNTTFFIPEYDPDAQEFGVSGIAALTANSKKLLDSARAAKEALKKKVALLSQKPIAVRPADGTVIHMPKTMLTQITGINTDPDNKAIESSVIVADHDTEDWFKTNWMVWGDTAEEAEAAYAAFCESLYDWLDQKGVVSLSKSYQNTTAGSSQLKNEKVVLMDVLKRKAIEEALYFGKTEEQFAAENALVGPELWKAWANMSRPWACDFCYADGTNGSPRDILVVKMPKYIYHHGKAIQIGGLYDNKPYKVGSCDNPVDLFAGQIMFWKPIRGQGGQLNGYGIKGFAFYAGSSVLERVLKKYGLTREEFFDCKVENIDGKLVRIGDYAGIATDDIWKFDKFFQSWEQYLATVDRLAAKWPVISKLGILRQAEDAEGQYKRRHSTRSLHQQLFSWTQEEVTNLVAPTATKIKALMSYENAITKLAGLGKDLTERTAIEVLFGAAPWLWMAPGVQAYWKNKLRSMVKELMANKLDAKGQYPYIVQDPVAMIEILVLGKRPEEAGILPTGYVSVADVPDGQELMVLRFPSNYLTARVRINKAMAEVFADLGNVCVLSIHDDILVVQDGDTDGDETCILYNTLIIELVKRMLAELDPPVVVFEHGTKAEKSLSGSVAGLRKKLAHARYMASHNDHTGIYADLARDCAMLAARAKAKGDDRLFQTYLVWMAAASTGAIISIDQVKGNDVSEVLEAWLLEISSKVRKAMGRKKPYTQQFLKADVSKDDCNKPQTESLPDAIAVEGRSQVGPYAVTSPFGWNGEAAKEACFVHDVPVCTIQKHPLNDVIKDALTSILYNDMVIVGKDGVERLIDSDFRAAVKAGQPVGLKDLIVYLYHNAQALKCSCEGALMSQKTQEFYALCWNILKEFAITDNKPSKTIANKTASVKVNSLYAVMVNEALELSRGNGVDDDDGLYRWFCLNVVAAALTATIKKNGWKSSDFQPGDKTTEDFDVEKKVETYKKIETYKEIFGSDEEEFYCSNENEEDYPSEAEYQAYLEMIEELPE